MVTGIVLLARCRYCRNSVRYLFSPWHDWARFRFLLGKRVRVLPYTHRYHGGPGCADANPPVRWRDRVRAR